MAADKPQSLAELLQTFLESNPSVPRADRATTELEVKFGTMGVRPVTRIDYDNVVNELYNHGFSTANASGKTLLRMQSEYLDPKSGRVKISNVRCEVSSVEAIHRYCKTNSLEAIADGSISFEQKMDVQREDHTYYRPANNRDFNFRTTLKHERPLSKQSVMVRDLMSDWSNKKKLFRLMNRVSFTHDTYPISVDMSIVRSSRRESGTMVPEYTIEGSGVMNDAENNEIELEVINRRTGSGTPWTRQNIDEFTAMVKSNIKTVLSGLQQTHYPVSYPEQSRVLQDYMKLVHGGGFEARRVVPRDFIGPSSLTAQVSNVAPANEDAIIPNVRSGYTVTEKADGLRKLLYVHKDGRVYLIDTNMNVQFTGGVSKDDDLAQTILDGEHILHNKKGEFINLYAAFDAYFVGGKDVRANGFIPDSEDVVAVKYRFPLLRQAVGQMRMESVVPGQLAPIRVEHKKFYAADQKQSIFNACALILDKNDKGLFEYATDGLIFTPSHLGVGATKPGEEPRDYKATWPNSLKWKPPHHNTIDFLVEVKKGASGEDAVGNVFQEGTDTGSAQQLTEYKTLVLRCGFDERKHGYLNPCQSVIEDKLPTTDAGSSDGYRPAPFYPTNPYDKNAHVANIMVSRDGGGGLQMMTEGGEVFDGNTIVEFKYHPEREVGWRWTPIKVRYDKTAELRQGFKNYGNAYHVANSNWHSIHNPVTAAMLATGRDIPDELHDDDVYYNKIDGPSRTKALRDFHNLYVKRALILGASKYGDTLIDYAVGKGGDFPKWIAAKLSFVFGIDIAKDNIENRLDGACARFLTYRKKFKVMPYALFVQGNSSVNIRSGAALFTEKGKQVTRAVFGEGPKDPEVLGEGVYRQYGKGTGGFNVSSCQFALHYFFESQSTLNNFVRNLCECTSVGGYFVGCCYDGRKVFNALSKKSKGESLVIMKGNTKIWGMTKEYDQSTLENNVSCLGYPIDVFQETIGKPFMEYLVNFEYFERVMENYGFVLPSAEELRGLQLPKATGSFADLFAKLESTAKATKLRLEVGQALSMSSEEKQISFYNRYFVFKKVRNVDADQLALAALDETPLEQATMEQQSKVASEAIEQATQEQQLPAAAPTEGKTKRRKPPKLRLRPEAVAPSPAGPAETGAQPPIRDEPALTPAPDEVVGAPPIAAAQPPTTTRRKKPKLRLPGDV